ncbi:hypothetical protein L227DRAFT_280670 [Lentinus tigrinus ALCF2SS1-6]|uniref:Uncharacterized protein n=1 Tax=Lentinus tigrinus ALCF2SS1-6 TaxID=1328759 RepID=A0A5C2SP94_9APHY|nr:hypothetical protein L227DRAFT_280670 [Lentinus tigrinus ALCF2SS1-6]
MPVRVEFLNGHPAPIEYANATIALRDIRTRKMRVQSLAVDEQSMDSVAANNVPKLLSEVRLLLEDLIISVVAPGGSLGQYQLFHLTPSEYPKLETLTIDGFLPSDLSYGFDHLQRLELRASRPLAPCVNVHALLMAMGTWSSLSELCLHHYMRIFTVDLLPGSPALPVALPPRLKNFVVEDSPDAVRCLLTRLILPPNVRSHFIASCPVFPADVGPLFQMLTPTPYVEFPAAPYKVNLPILEQVSQVLVEFTDNLKVIGTNKQGGTIILEIRAPPPIPDGLATRPTLLCAAIRRLPELFYNGLESDQQLVESLVVNGDVSRVNMEDWLSTLRRYNLRKLYVTDRAMSSPRAVLRALCPQEDAGEIACRGLDTLKLVGYPHGDQDDFAALLHTLQMRSKENCNLAILALGYLWEPSSDTESLGEAKDNIETEVRKVSPNVTELQVEISMEGLRVFCGGYI